MDMSVIVSWSLSAGHETFMVQVEDSDEVHFHQQFETYEEAMKAGDAAFKAAMASVTQTSSG
jgi:predicted RNase H-like HicB family nuclease